MCVKQLSEVLAFASVEIRNWDLTGWSAMLNIEAPVVGDPSNLCLICHCFVLCQNGLVMFNN